MNMNEVISFGVISHRQQTRTSVTHSEFQTRTEIISCSFNLSKVWMHSYSSSHSSLQQVCGQARFSLNTYTCWNFFNQQHSSSVFIHALNRYCSPLISTGKRLAEPATVQRSSAVAVCDAHIELTRAGQNCSNIHGIQQASGRAGLRKRLLLGVYRQPLHQILFMFFLFV